MTNRIICHERETLLKLNCFLLMEQHHSWDSILMPIYQIDFAFKYEFSFIVLPDVFYCWARQTISFCVYFLFCEYLDHTRILLCKKYMATPICAVHAKTIQKFDITYPSQETVKMVTAAIALHIGQKETWLSILNFLVQTAHWQTQSAISF